jgi:hypothetical protein
MSGFTRARNVCLGAAAAAAALGVFVSTSAGSSSSRAATHHATAFRAARTRATSGGYVYILSTVVTVAAGKTGSGTLKCPTNAPHPVSGEFDSTSALVLLSDSFANSTKTGWTTQLTNAGHTSAKVQIGVVCHT